MAPGDPSHRYQRSPQNKGSRIGGILRVTPHPCQVQLGNRSKQKEIYLEACRLTGALYFRVYITKAVYQSSTMYSLTIEPKQRLREIHHTNIKETLTTEMIHATCIFKRLSEMILLGTATSDLQKNKKGTCLGACRQIDTLNFRV